MRHTDDGYLHRFSFTLLFELSSLMKATPLSNPRELIRRWQAGELKRAELHVLMAEHQKAILEEAEQQRLNPVAAFVEGVMNRRAARKLIHRHGEAAVRELLRALSDEEDFEPSSWLWNVGHWDVPLHCFLRSRSSPLFMVREMWVKRDRAQMKVQYGDPRDPRQKVIQFERDWRGMMRIIQTSGTTAGQRT